MSSADLTIPSSVDVIVVGTGVAGLASAVEAARAGATTLVLEAAETIGGASVMSGAACCFVGTPEQDELGIEDSLELALADWAALGGETADLEWARRYLLESCSEVRDWLADLGIRWVAVDQQEGNSVPRRHFPEGWGRRIVELLAAECERLGVRIFTGCRVEELVSAERRVTGVRLAQPHGTNIEAGSVVVATGGYVADLARVLDHAPNLRHIPRLLAGGAPTATGTGHAMLERVDARFSHLENIWVYPTGTPDPTDPKHHRGLGLRGVATELWLNVEGQRFHDEAERGGHAGTNALLAQPEMTCYAIFAAGESENILLIDNEYFGTPAGPDPVGVQEFWSQSEHAWRGEDAASLARAVGLPVEAVTETIDTFNDLIRNGVEHDPHTGRSLKGLTTLEGPLVAIQLFPMAQKNFGGVSTDFTCAVVDHDGAAIAGLYAAGEVAGMAGGSINGKAGLEGTMFGPCVWSGRIAGQSAAKASRGQDTH